MSTKKKHRIDLSGRRYHFLTVLKLHDTIKGQRRWLCQCDCGGKKVVPTGSLNSGNTKSCGCLHKQRVRSANRKHGLSGKSCYWIWANMRQRCRNPNSLDYPRYGGRGISVCERWNDFAAFLLDMGERPSLKHSLDRIDPLGNYCPENCRWATASEQASNKPSLQKLFYQGEYKTVSEWCRHLGIKENMVRKRLCRGWSVGRALEQPERSTRFKLAPPRQV